MGHRLTTSVYRVDITWTYTADAGYVRTERLLVHTGVEQKMKAHVRCFLACASLRTLTSPRFGGIKTYAPGGEEGCTIRAELVARSALTPRDYAPYRIQYL